MATNEYHHGASPTEVSGSAPSVSLVSTARIGMVCTAEDADATAFPLNTPVLLTQPKLAIAKAGTKGTLAASLKAISDLVTCPTVVVRVAEGADDAQTSSNVIGTVDANGKYTGMQALLTAEATTGVRPRIIGMPGLDTEEVTTATAIIAKKLLGFAYASCDDAASVSDCLAYRQKFSGRELMLIYPDFTVFDQPTSTTVKAQTIAYALGLRALIDQTVGFHKSLSNVAVDGINGITAPVYFNFQQSGTDADLLNAQGITTLINRDGFRFWGSRTCDSAEFIFEPYTRTAQVLRDSMADAMFAYADQPASAGLIRDVIDSFNAAGKVMVRAGQLLGFKASFDATLNTVDQMKNGKFAVSYQYTPVPPFEQVALQQTFTDTYFADLATAVASGSTD